MIRLSASGDYLRHFSCPFFANLTIRTHADRCSTSVGYFVKKMSARDQMRAMLDTLMGTARDGNGIVSCFGFVALYFHIFLQVRATGTMSNSQIQKSARVFCWRAVRMKSWHLL